MLKLFTNIDLKSSINIQGLYLEMKKDAVPVGME
jgi:hypothetical protein